MKLSKVEKKALAKLSRNKWLSAYESKVGLNTLEILASKGLVHRRADLGSMSFPLTGLKFKKKLRRR